MEVVEADGDHDEFADDVARLPPVAPAPATRPKPRPVAAAPRLNQIQTSDEASLHDWISSLAGDAEIRTNITRKKPILGPNGENIAGSLETISERFDEEYIRETWGGGTFRIRITAAGPRGDYKFVPGGQRDIILAGKPRMHGQELGAATASVVSTVAEDTLAERAFNTMAQTAREDRQRADQLQREQRQQPAGMDFAAIQALNQPLFEQLAAAQRTISELQQQMISISSKPAPRDEFRDALMERAISGESKQLDALRAIYDARIEKMRDNHDDQIKRMEDRHDKAITALEARHDREIRGVEKAGEGQTKNTDSAFQMRIEVMNSDKARLERELTAAATKIAALEARKDQTITEKADEILKVQEALESLGGGKDDGEEPWYQKIVSTVGSLPAVNTMLEKLTGPAPTQPGQQPQNQNQLPPPGVPFQTGDGYVYVSDAAGNVSIVDQGGQRQQRAIANARKRKRAAAQAASEAPAATEGEEDAIEEGLEDGGVEQPPVGKAPSASDVKMAVNFMENAIRSGATPEAFGATARNLLPADTLAFVQQIGPEEFLNKWAKLESGSPLASIRGREFARKVFKFLVGDTSE